VVDCADTAGLPGPQSRTRFAQDLLPGTARVLFVDDCIDTGGQAIAARQLVLAAGATWCGVSVIVDALTDGRRRRDLKVTAIFRDRDF
jgi:adenine phosphoribosyltransferase